jgi:hypothetical protein
MEKAFFRYDNGANTLRSKGSTKGYVDHYNDIRLNSAIGYITCSPGISGRFRPTGIGNWMWRGNSGRIAASGPREG